MIQCLINMYFLFPIGTEYFAHTSQMFHSIATLIKQVWPQLRAIVIIVRMLRGWEGETLQWWCFEGERGLGCSVGL